MYITNLGHIRSKRLFMSRLDDMRERHENAVMYTDQWLSNKTVCSYVATSKPRGKGALFSYALLSKVDVDPAKSQEYPWCLNYVFTFPSHRRSGIMRKILDRVKSDHMATAFVSSEEGTALFKNCGFVQSKDDADKFTTPITPIHGC